MKSIESQLRAMHDFCERNRITVVREFCDHARSATTDDRPEFQNMIEASKEHDFDLAIVHKLDRFSRNRYDSAYYKRELKKNGVTLMSVLKNLDDSPESIILESVLEGMSEYYSKNLACEVMKGMRESAMDCRYTGGFVPYGFVVDKETYKYQINEYEAEAVRMVFRDVADGVGYNEVLTKFNGMGYRTRLGNPFCKSTLYEMLRNEKYDGVYIFNRASSKNESGRRNNHPSKLEDEMIRIPGGMPRIVDSETFARVQNILIGRKHKSPYSKAIETYLLAGKVHYGLCGFSYNGIRQFSGRTKSKLVNYRCGHRHNTGAGEYLGKHKSLWRVRCERCGREYILDGAHIGVTKACACNRDKHLDAGRKVYRDNDIEGTNLIAISPDRKANRNSSTGIKGVSPHNGKFRAALVFKRKQYYLGEFDTIEEAAAARKRAEEKIYGEFLDAHKNDSDE